MTVGETVGQHRNAAVAASMTPAAVAVTWFFTNVLHQALSTEDGRRRAERRRGGPGAGE